MNLEGFKQQHLSGDSRMGNQIEFGGGGVMKFLIMEGVITLTLPNKLVGGELSSNTIY